MEGGRGMTAQSEKGVGRLQMEEGGVHQERDRGWSIRGQGIAKEVNKRAYKREDKMGNIDAEKGEDYVQKYRFRGFQNLSNLVFCKISASTIVAPFVTFF